MVVAHSVSHTTIATAYCVQIDRLVLCIGTVEMVIVVFLNRKCQLSPSW